MSINSKELQRKNAILSWKNMPQSTRNSLTQNLLVFVEQHEPIRRIFAYWSLSTEPDIIDFCEVNASRLYLPVLRSDLSLDFFPYTGKSELIRNSVGAFEPPRDRYPPATPATYSDLVIIPALGANQSGARLGRGGGYYDRSHAMLSESTRVSLIPEFLTSLNFPAEDHDLLLNCIITENGPVDY